MVDALNFSHLLDWLRGLGQASEVIVQLVGGGQDESLRSMVGLLHHAVASFGFWSVQNLVLICICSRQMVVPTLHMDPAEGLARSCIIMHEQNSQHSESHCSIAWISSLSICSRPV